MTGVQRYIDRDQRQSVRNVHAYTRKDHFGFKEISFFNKTPEMWILVFIGVRQGGAVWQQGGKAERKGRAQ